MTETPLETIGILAPGEMGSALADVFRRNGCRVITSVQNRSDRTKQIVKAAQLETLPTLQEVVDQSSILISTAPPQHAADLAKEVVDLVPREGTLYIDANSIAPQTTRHIHQLVSSAGMTMVDMAIRGLASKLVQQGAIYLSGPQLERIAPLLRPIETEDLGDEVGSASLLKMLMGGLSKGVATLVMELGVGAERAGILDRFLQGVGRYYPDVMAAMESVLPTYPQHAGRRAHELHEVAACLAECGIESQVVAGSGRLLQSCSQTDLEQSSAQLKTANVHEIIRALSHQSSFLSLSTGQPFVDSH
ncbi:tartronate semialdehyde reductase [Bremerella volcania]|uniref:Tartronate semialdehyde reductase n=1 Tax=Bremerella volcania TaxID=2527984 RepID=A0A518C936_9BACT|nr:NAD(P)-dependent oxidoreductase [Bremerella volcania]QDU75745.1 tartronate semialdehyde reductase [Bremerella volcania]